MVYLIFITLQALQQLYILYRCYNHLQSEICSICLCFFDCHYAWSAVTVGIVILAGNRLAELVKNRTLDNSLCIVCCCVYKQNFIIHFIFRACCDSRNIENAFPFML